MSFILGGITRVAPQPMRPNAVEILRRRHSAAHKAGGAPQVSFADAKTVPVSARKMGHDLDHIKRAERRVARHAAICTLVALAFLAAPSASTAWAVGPGTPGCGGLGGGMPSTEASIVSGGVSRTYRLQVPASYDGATPVPLVLNFHGYTQNASYQENASGFASLVDKVGFILVHPQGLGRPPAWNAGGAFAALVPLRDDVAFVSDLIDHLGTKYCIDPARVLATGFSNGGGLADLLGCKLADRVTAIAPVSGGLPRRSEECRPSARVAVVAVHGDADGLTPYEGDSTGLFQPVPGWLAEWAKRNGCKGEPSRRLVEDYVLKIAYHHCPKGGAVRLYRVLDGGHEWFDGATQWIWNFFASYGTRSATETAGGSGRAASVARGSATAAQLPSCGAGATPAYAFDGIPGQAAGGRWYSFALVARADAGPRSIADLQVSAAAANPAKPITFAYTIQPDSSMLGSLPLRLESTDGPTLITAAWTEDFGGIACSQSIGAVVTPVAGTEPPVSVRNRSPEVEFDVQSPGPCVLMAGGLLRIRVSSGGLPRSIALVDPCASWDATDAAGGRWRLAAAKGDAAKVSQPGLSLAGGRLARFAPGLRRPGLRRFNYKVALAGRTLRQGAFNISSRRIARRRIFQGGRAFARDCVKKRRKIRSRDGKRFCWRPSKTTYRVLDLE